MQSKSLVVKAIIVKDDKFLVLVKPNAQVDLPGGHLEKGEGACQGLIREVSEETGLVVRRSDRPVAKTAPESAGHCSRSSEYPQCRI